MGAFADAFARSDGALGAPWSVLRGSVVVKQQRAFADFSSDTTAGAFAVIDAGVGGNDARVSVSIPAGTDGGHAVYFRVVDAANWWRFSLRRFSYQTGGGQIIGYQQVQVGTRTVQTGTRSDLVGYDYTTSWNNRDGFGNVTSSGRRTNVYPVPGYPDPVLSEPFPGSGYYIADVTYDFTPHYQQVAVYGEEPIFESQPIYSNSTTVFDYSLRVDRSVAGVVTTVRTVDTGDRRPGSLVVAAQGPLITCYTSLSTQPAFPVINDTGFASATRHGVGISRTTSSPTALGVDDFVVTPFNVAPGSPTLLSPVANQAADRTGTIRFRWQFNDPDAGDSQSKYDLRYRVVGASAFTEVTGSTPNTFHDLEPTALAAGSYEWQVRTYDAQGLVGPYSASEFFTAATPPAGPVWTDPVSGQIIGAETFTATYSAAAQVARQTRVVADLNGVADEATVLYGSDSGRVVTDSRTVVLSFPVNGAKVHLQVRVETGGLWSAWATVPASVSYTPPAVPGITLTGDGTNILVVPVTAPPTGGQPSVTYVDLFVRSDGDRYRPFGGTRIATRLAPSQAYLDATIASGVDYAYQLRAYASNGTSSVSPWIDKLNVFISPDGLVDELAYANADYDPADYD